MPLRRPVWPGRPQRFRGPGWYAEAPLTGRASRRRGHQEPHDESCPCDRADCGGPSHPRQDSDVNWVKALGLSLLGTCVSLLVLGAVRLRGTAGKNRLHGATRKSTLRGTARKNIL